MQLKKLYLEQTDKEKMFINRLLFFVVVGWIFIRYFEELAPRNYLYFAAILIVLQLISLVFVVRAYYKVYKRVISKDKKG